MIKIIMPLYIEKKNGKKIHLNLNNYRNWHHHTSNNIKKIKVWSDIKDLVYIFQEGYKYRFSDSYGVFDYYPTSTSLKFNKKKG